MRRRLRHEEEEEDGGRPRSRGRPCWLPSSVAVPQASPLPPPRWITPPNAARQQRRGGEKIDYPRRVQEEGPPVEEEDSCGTRTAICGGPDEEEEDVVVVVGLSTTTTRRGRGGRCRSGGGGMHDCRQVEMSTAILNVKTSRYCRTTAKILSGSGGWWRRALERPPQGTAVGDRWQRRRRISAAAAARTFAVRLLAVILGCRILGGGGGGGIVVVTNGFSVTTPKGSLRLVWPTPSTVPFRPGSRHNAPFGGTSRRMPSMRLFPHGRGEAGDTSHEEGGSRHAKTVPDNQSGFQRLFSRRSSNFNSNNGTADVGGDETWFDEDGRTHRSNPDAAPQGAAEVPEARFDDGIATRSVLDDDDDDSASTSFYEGLLDDDFEAWALGLGQWPLLPDLPPSTTAQGRKDWSLSDGSTDPDSGEGNPLASLVDLEALWRALQLRGIPSSMPSSEADPPTVADSVDGVEPKASHTAQTENVTAASEGSILDGLYGILSIERILRAGNLFQVFESDRSGGTPTEVPQTTQPKAAASLPTAKATNASSSPDISKGKNSTLFQQATSQLESFVGDASALFASPSIVMDFIGQAAQILQETTKNTTQTLMAIRELQKQQDQEEKERARTTIDAVEGAGGGPREDEAERRVKAALAFSANLVAVADAVLRQGYVAKRPSISNKTTAVAESAAGVATRPTSASPKDSSRALFADFATAREVQAYSQWLAKGAEMGALSGAVYEQTVPRTHALNHTIVATGVTADVAWMVTDALATDASFASTTASSGSVSAINGTTSTKIANSTAAKSTGTSPAPFLVRTITLRGFDASDENVDREGLLMRVCTASPETFKTRKGSVVQFHSGMWGMARALYRELKPYVSWTAPSHKIVIAGHSVGGSLAVLVLLLMTMDMGPDFVAAKVRRVYTYGSPPVARRRFVTDEDRQRNALRRQESPTACRCDVLEAFDLPASLVEGYVQPWDPIVRLFSEIDPLYPLLGDVGADGVTPWASGPPRTLRPITKAIMEAWEGWPRFRDTLASTGNQTYRSVGVQHVLIPEPTRYLADRFVGVNVQVPPVTTLLRISSNELLPALQVVFPLDVFEISFVPQAIRSFVHHFYPAYGFPLVDYVKRLESPPPTVPPSPSSKQSSPKDMSLDEPANGDAGLWNVEDDLRRTSEEQSDLMSDLARAAQWLRGKD